eukprot:SAG11_NODE_4_length_33019_cov_28.098909_23_plen_77_part_00
MAARLAISATPLREKATIDIGRSKSFQKYKRSLFSEGILRVGKGGGREVLVIVKFRGLFHHTRITRSSVVYFIIPK